MGFAFICLFIVLFMLFGNTTEKEAVEVDQENSEVQVSLLTKKNEKSIATIYVLLAASMIKKNGKDSRAKIKFLHQFLARNFKDSSKEIGDSFTLGLRNPINVRSISNWICKKMQEPQERANILIFLIDLAFVDGDLIDREYVAIIRFGELIGVNPSFIDGQIKARKKENVNKNANDIWVGNSEYYRSKALNVLQITGEATEIEIKRAYRKLVNRYHPDKNNLKSNEEIQFAQSKFLEIQKAYEYLSSSN